MGHAALIVALLFLTGCGTSFFTPNHNRKNSPTIICNCGDEHAREEHEEEEHEEGCEEG